MRFYGYDLTDCPYTSGITQGQSFDMLLSNDVYNAVRMALHEYNLPQPIQIEPPLQHNHVSMLIHTPHATLRCKMYSTIYSQQAILYEHWLLEQLAAQQPSFTLPLPIKGRDGSTLQSSSIGYLALVPYLPGALLDPTNLEQVMSLGEAVGELHQKLALLDQIARPGTALFNTFFDFPPPERNPFQLQPAMIAAESTAEAQELCAWWRNEALILDNFVKGAYQLLPTQLVHNDLAPYNILTIQNRVSTVLDFEFAGLAPRAFDLAMALRMTMRIWENPDPWTTARHFCAGYREWGWLSIEECAAMPQLMMLRSAMGTLWSLGRNAEIDTKRFLQHLQFLRNASKWLDQNGQRLVEVLVKSPITNY